MEDLGIVFNHHDTSPTALRNLEAIRRLNPGARVFTVSAHEPFPGGASMEDLGEGGAIWTALTQGNQKLEWRHCDWLSYAWILAGGVRCRRWVFVGWDVYSTVPLEEFLSSVWDENAAGVEVFVPQEHDWWHWFKEGVPKDLEPHRRGVCPVCFYLCSDECARAVADLALKRKKWDAFCELRLGTLISAAGFEPKVIPGARKTISWKWEGWTIEGKGIWHPVKNVVPS